MATGVEETECSAEIRISTAWAVPGATVTSVADNGRYGNGLRRQPALRLRAWASTSVTVT